MNIMKKITGMTRGAKYTERYKKINTQIKYPHKLYG